jgi:drug/metabolite transporter (DMT)-like permease
LDVKRWTFSSAMNPARLIVLTSLAMIAFASNSLLCRFALKQTNIDAASFTLIRILSGAAALWIIMSVLGRTSSTEKARESRMHGSWVSALALFAYAAAFSFAYVHLPAGTGALLLFGAVQATMILWGFGKGERLDAIQVAGIVVALTGLVVLLFPGLTAPPIGGSLLMITAGIAWGIYSLRGKGEKNPVAATTGNFVRAVPLAIAVSAAMSPWMRFDPLGMTYAVISGAITSGVGYVIWYSALPGLKAVSAATVQLSVPVLAATGGILLLSEPISVRYLLASIAVLGGIALVVIEKSRAA